jgi:hypothetical protein
VHRYTATGPRSHPPVDSACRPLSGGVDRGLADQIGRSYLDGRSAAPAPVVAVAYTRLQEETDRLFGGLFHRPVHRLARVVFTRADPPYACDRELIEAVRSERTLEITTAAVTRGRIHPVLGREVGGPLDRLRAVHDMIGHVLPGSGFDLDGEFAAWLAQDRLYTRLARWALATEVIGVNSARSVVGEPPELKAMLLDPRLLARSRSGAGTDGPTVPAGLLPRPTGPRSP